MLIENEHYLRGSTHRGLIEGRGTAKAKAADLVQSSIPEDHNVVRLS